MLVSLLHRYHYVLVAIQKLSIDIAVMLTTTEFLWPSLALYESHKFQFNFNLEWGYEHHEMSFIII